MDILWTKQMSVGNRIIDTAHKELLSTVNRIGHLVRSKSCAAVAGEFNLLKDQLHACFTVEEKIAQAVEFPFALHKRAHQGLLEQFQRISDRLAAMSGMWTDDEGESCCYHLRHYLVKHFKEESAQIKVVLDTHFYDLRPD